MLAWADFNPAVGPEQAGKRPVLIISNNVVNQVLPIVTVLPVSSVKEGAHIYPTEVSLSKERLESKCTDIDDKNIKRKINEVIKKYFELE